MVIGLPARVAEAFAAGLAKSNSAMPIRAMKNFGVRIIITIRLRPRGSDITVVYSVNDCQTSHHAALPKAHGSLSSRGPKTADLDYSRSGSATTRFGGRFFLRGFDIGDDFLRRRLSGLPKLCPTLSGMSFAEHPCQLPVCARDPGGIPAIHPAAYSYGQGCGVGMLCFVIAGGCHEGH